MPGPKYSGMNKTEFCEFAQMKADISTLKDDVGEIKKNLSEFIDKADNTYARKDEVAELKTQVNKTSDRLLDLAFKVATIAGLAGIGSKMAGLW